MDKAYLLAKEQLNDILRQKVVSNSCITPLLCSIAFLIEFPNKATNLSEPLYLPYLNYSHIPWEEIKTVLINSNLINRFYYALSFLDFTVPVKTVFYKYLKLGPTPPNTLEDVAFLMNFKMSMTGSYPIFKIDLEIKACLQEREQIQRIIPIIIYCGDDGVSKI